MKTLLIPALALTLASLPAHAQKTAAPAAPTPLPAVASPSALANFPGLLRKVQFDDAALGEVIAYLNVKLAEQKSEPLNVVVSAGLESTKVPNILLQNVTATDVLNVVAKMIDLTVEPVPSDSGKVAAWIITKAKPVAWKKRFEPFGSGIEAEEGGLGKTPIPDQNVKASTAPGPRSPGAMRGGAGYPDFAVIQQWIDPASPAPAPAEVSRVIGIGKIFDQFAGKDEREKKEAELADRLTNIAKNEGMECKVSYYGNLQVIVLKGTPEGVAFIEQTVAAMKENAGGRKSGGSSLPGGF